MQVLLFILILVQLRHNINRAATFQSASSSPTFPATSSYIYVAEQTASNIIDISGNTKAQLI